MAESRSRQLLEQFNFKVNPFSLREAEREDSENFESYTYKHPLFFELLGDPARPESAIIIAARGAGKTTLRQLLALYCHEQRRPVEDVLAVSYTEFSNLLSLVRAANREAEVTDHVDELLRCAVTSLLHGVERWVKNWAEMGKGEATWIRAYIAAYSPIFDRTDMGITIDRLIKQLAAENDFILGQDSSELLGEDGPEVVAALPEWLRPIAITLRDIFAQPVVPLPASYLHRLRSFLNLLTTLGYNTMYVLIDRLDESSLLTRAEDVARFITPLLTDLQLLEEPHLAFKIFLPQHIASLIPYRSKRLAAKHLVWSEDQLLELLQQRLSGFGDTRTMRVFCTGDLADRVVDLSTQHRRVALIDARLVRSAKGLPRNLILICRKLFEFYDAADRMGKITDEDLTKALAADLGTDEPVRGPVDKAGQGVSPSAEESAPPHGLFVDSSKHIWRDGKKLNVRLTSLELRLLEYLCEHRYQLCRNDDIKKVVWPYAEVSDEQFRTTLRRLRHKVEPISSGEPIYIITRRGMGVQLEDGDQTE